MVLTIDIWCHAMSCSKRYHTCRTVEVKCILSVWHGIFSSQMFSWVKLGAWKCCENTWTFKNFFSQDEPIRTKNSQSFDVNWIFRLSIVINLSQDLFKFTSLTTLAYFISLMSRFGMPPMNKCSIVILLMGPIRLVIDWIDMGTF